MTVDFLKELVEKIVVIDNTTILNAMKETKKEGYRYLLVQSEICDDYGAKNKDETIVMNVLRFYKSNDINQLSNKNGTLYDLQDILIL